MLKFEEKENRLVVYENDKVVGKLFDVCCDTIIRVETNKQYGVRVKYQTGMGGYLSKKASIGGKLEYIYREKMMEIFTYVYNSEKLRNLKKEIRISRNDIEDNTYLKRLREYENS
jgi:hypothetical protein